MYCNGTEIAQAQIQFGDKIYSCGSNSVQFTLLEDLNNSSKPSSIEMECNVFEGKDLNQTFYCEDKTLISKVPIVCNSTREMRSKNSEESVTVLQCYEGSLPIGMTGFIPTTTTEAPEKSLSFGAKVHVFFLHLIGKGDVLETKSKADEDPRLSLKDDETPWIPEALPITSPETETSTSTTTPKPEVFVDSTYTGPTILVHFFPSNVVNGVPVVYTVIKSYNELSYEEHKKMTGSYPPGIARIPAPPATTTKEPLVRQSKDHDEWTEEMMTFLKT